MKIESSFKQYAVDFTEDFNFFSALAEEHNSFFIIDLKVYELYKERLFSDISLGQLYLLEAEESNKKIETALQVCETMTNHAAKRNMHLISIGGGIVQDVTGFVANILYRGIQWTFIPTTLLAACDSCIGGKTSLNYKQFKNLLGTFFPPDQIIIWPEFFNTLSEKDFQSGLGEVVKFNIMSGVSGLVSMEQNIDHLLSRDNKKLEYFVEKSLLFKKHYIEADEFDKGLRIHLNYAHTFGHAIESVTGYEVPHGTAVAIGMLIANRISCMRGMITESLLLRIEGIIKKIINIKLETNNYYLVEIINAIRKDKKQVDENLTAVLLNNEFALQICRDIKIEEINDAFQHVKFVIMITD